MNRFSYCTLAVVCVIVLSGCRAPMPSFRSSHLLSPFGSTKVPPPATQSIAKAQGYNTSGPASATTTNGAAGGWRTATSTSGTTPASQLPSGDTRLVPQASSSSPATSDSPSNRFAQGTSASAVQPAAYVTTSGTSGQTRTIGTGEASVQLKGMHVNEAAAPQTPGTFVESPGFSEVPAATTPGAPAGAASSPTAASPPDMTSNPGAAPVDSVSVTATDVPTESSLNWRTRGA